MKKAGGQRRVNGRFVSNHTEWDVTMAHRLRAEGLTIASIAQKLEIPFYTVRDWLRCRYPSSTRGMKR